MPRDLLTWQPKKLAKPLPPRNPEHELKKIPPPSLGRIAKALVSLANDPCRACRHKVVVVHDALRIWIGLYRAIYRVTPTDVTVLKPNQRAVVYRL